MYAVSSTLASHIHHSKPTPVVHSSSRARSYRSPESRRTQMEPCPAMQPRTNRRWQPSSDIGLSSSRERPIIATTSSHASSEFWTKIKTTAKDSSQGLLPGALAFALFGAGSMPSWGSVGESQIHLYIPRYIRPRNRHTQSVRATASTLILPSSLTRPLPLSPSSLT